MRARDRDLPAFAGAEHGVEAGLVGIGDALACVPASLAQAVGAAEREHGAKAAHMLRRFAGLSDGALVWTRTGEARYALGRIAGPWRYDDGAAARAVGIHHIRPTRWLRVSFGPDAVPVAVAETFARGGRNLQRIHSDLAERQSVALWTDDFALARQRRVSQPAPLSRQVGGEAAHGARTDDR